MWPGAAASRSINYPHPHSHSHPEMGMLGLRDLFVVAPASSFHNHHHHDVAVMPDPHAATIIPLLTAAPCLAGVDTDNMMVAANHNRTRSGGIHLWQDYNIKKHHQGLVEQHISGSSDNNLSVAGTSGLIAGGTTCQDCGNQAKKDCTHRRCRTCCKSRGFDCPTHVKSTWVPAARRRERQLMTAAAAATGASIGSTSGTKKPRLIASQTTTTSHTSTSNTTPPRSFDTSSSHQDASFKESMPRQIRAQAVFKCVRVTGVEESEDEYAYQAVVKIGGHVFKGFLYDQGLHNTNSYPNLSDLHLGGGADSAAGRNGNGATSSSHQIMDPSDVYAAAAAGGFLPGSTYNANPIN